MKLNYKKIYEAHAEICKTLANPKRLEILFALSHKERTVNELSKITKIRKSNISQHLAILKLHSVVTARRTGRNIFYKVSSPKIIRACNLMREVLIDKIKKEQIIFL